MNISKKVDRIGIDMANNLRRTALKSFALTLPAAWAAPVVRSVVLPAHAQTSACTASEGCYVFSLGQGVASFSWPGGIGPATVKYYIQVRDCGQLADFGFVDLLVAASLEDAASKFSCDAIELPTLADFPSGCTFYVCRSDFPTP
jgi:hypothetical protein